MEKRKHSNRITEIWKTTKQQKLTQIGYLIRQILTPNKIPNNKILATSVI